MGLFSLIPINRQFKYFVYNENNQLIAEYDNNNNVISEYFYFGLRPVAVKTNGSLHIVHTDYLGTPRVITNGTSGGNIVWEWKSDNPYGNNKAEGSIEFNLRFAGQYYDYESGLHYNMNRTYNPETGRYMQSDPIGLNGGFNTYNYVNKNPLNNVDPLGLLERDKNGNLIFYNVEPAEPFKNKDIPSIRVEAVQGYLKTDKGNLIRAYKRTGPNPKDYDLDYTADCHGWSFADGKYWIDNEEVDTILADEYYFVPSKDLKNIQDGDKIIYRELGLVAHSLTVRQIGNYNLSEEQQGQFTQYQAYGKGGNEPRPYLQSIRYGWQSQANPVNPVKLYLYRKISK